MIDSGALSRSASVFTAVVVVLDGADVVVLGALEVVVVVVGVWGLTVSVALSSTFGSAMTLDVTS